MTNLLIQEIYTKNFLPLYNSGNYNEAEVVVRKNDLGMMLDKEQFKKLFCVAGHKSRESATGFLDNIYRENVDGALDSFHENEEINNYWIKVLGMRIK